MLIPVVGLLSAALAGPQSTPFEASGEVRSELGSTRLVLEGGALTRWREGEQLSLGCTDATGPGRVHDIAADPAGLTFVAAERGLYVVGPMVDHLDRVRLAGGAPGGEPSTVHVDDRRRVWIATDAAVGVIEPSFAWGRTLPAQVLPGAPPYRLEAEDGALRIYGTEGERTYVPDSGERPEVEAVVVDGASVPAGGRVAISHGDRPAIAATGAGLGGATFRYRVDGHHIWRAMDDPRALDRMDPGVRRVEVVAIDRDLRFSTPFPIEVEVAIPRYYRKEFVVVCGAVAALVVFLFAFVVQRRSMPLHRRAVAGAATTAVVLVFGLQVVAGLVPHAKGWPFVGYSMYSSSFDPEHPVYREILVVQNGRGAQREVDPAAVGGAIDGRWQVLGPIVRGGPDVSRDALEILRVRTPSRRWNTLQVQAQRTRLTADGPIPIAPLVLSHYHDPGASGGAR